MTASRFPPPDLALLCAGGALIGYGVTARDLGAILCGLALMAWAACLD